MIIGTDINALLECSVELDQAIASLIEASYPDSRKRIESGRVLCCVSVEHAQSLKALIALGNFTSAVGLLRLQYEAVVRAMWVTYSATDEWVEILSSELTTDSAKRANKIPLLGEMLGNLEDKAPVEALNDQRGRARFISRMKENLMRKETIRTWPLWPLWPL